MRVAVITNPRSGRGGGAKRRDTLVSALADAGLDYKIVETTAPGSAIRTGRLEQGTAGFLAREAALEGADVVAAAGGDGTIGEVANGLLGTSAALGVLPMGTGNDFARCLGIETDLAIAARTLATGKTREVDVGQIEGGGVFVNVAGCGFDAEVARRINQGYRYVRGTTAYVLAALQTLGRFTPAPISLEIDGVRHEEKVMLCAVANATSYGGGMRIAPDADMSDGFIDVVLVGDVGRGEFLRAFPSVFKGTHTSHPKVKIMRGARVSISSDRGLLVLGDGEELGTLPASFAAVPKALRVISP